jgi:MFS family permease
LADVTADEAARRRAVAAWSAAGAVAGACGFLVGGILTQVFGWRTVFWINIPVSVGLAIVLARVLPRRRVEPTSSLDLAGAATLRAAVMGLVTGGAVLARPATLQVYRPVDDEQARHRGRLLRELEAARYELRGMETRTFSVPLREGRDDYLMSLAGYRAHA